MQEKEVDCIRELNKKISLIDAEKIGEKCKNMSSSVVLVLKQ